MLGREKRIFLEQSADSFRKQRDAVASLVYTHTEALFVISGAMERRIVSYRDYSRTRRILLKKKLHVPRRDLQTLALDVLGHSKGL